MNGSNSIIACPLKAIAERAAGGAQGTCREGRGHFDIHAKIYKRTQNPSMNVVRVRRPPSAPVHTDSAFEETILQDTNVFLRTIGCAALLAPGILVPSALFAQASESAWPAALICQASVQSYFYLKQPPRQIDESFGWLIFKSSLGGVYDCQVRGSFIALKWKSHNGTMTSNNTQVDANGSVLTVRPGGVSQWRFRRVADGYGLLNEGRPR